VIALTSVASSIGGFLDGSYLFAARSDTGVEMDAKTARASGLWLGGSALTDVTIAVSMIYYLSQSAPGFQPARALVSKVIRVIIETGFVTALLALVTIGLFYALPEKNYYYVSALLIPNLYANTMLAVLNSRFRIIGGRETDPSATEMASLPEFARSSGRNSGSMTNPIPGIASTHEISAEREFALVERKGLHASSNSLAERGRAHQLAPSMTATQ